MDWLKSSKGTGLIDVSSEESNFKSSGNGNEESMSPVRSSKINSAPVDTPWRNALMSPVSPRSEFQKFANSDLSPIGLATPVVSVIHNIPTSKDWSPLGGFSGFDPRMDCFSETPTRSSRAKRHLNETSPFLDEIGLYSTDDTKSHFARGVDSFGSSGSSRPFSSAINNGIAKAKTSESSRGISSEYSGKLDPESPGLITMAFAAESHSGKTSMRKPRKPISSHTGNDVGGFGWHLAVLTTSTTPPHSPQKYVPQSHESVQRLDETNDMDSDPQDYRRRQPVSRKQKSKTQKVSSEQNKKKLNSTLSSTSNSNSVPSQSTQEKISEQIPSNDHIGQQHGGDARSPEILTTDMIAPTISPVYNTDINNLTRISCNCKKTKCLKLYCECFRVQKYCSGCKCNDCHNLENFESERLASITSITERNPEAFKPRIGVGYESYIVSNNLTIPQTANTDVANSSLALQNLHEIPVGGQHITGCHCKKSACLKKYCECFQASVACQDRCRCIDCKNTSAVLPLSKGLSEKEFSQSSTQIVPLATVPTIADKFGPSFKSSMNSTKPLQYKTEIQVDAPVKSKDDSQIVNSSSIVASLLAAIANGNDPLAFNNIAATIASEVAKTPLNEADAKSAAIEIVSALLRGHHVLGV